MVVTIKDELNKVEEDVGSVDFDGVGDDLREISNDDMNFSAYVTFWSLVGFASVLALIVLLTYLGLLFSCCPEPTGRVIIVVPEKWLQLVYCPV